MSVHGWRTVGLGLCALLAVDHSVARAQVGVTQSNQKKTLACDGQDASVTGSLNEITFTGECPAVTIKGSENTIAIEATGQIRVVGSKNKVTWQRSTVDKGPRITKSGLGNVVSRAVAAAGDAGAGAGSGAGAGAGAGAGGGKDPGVGMKTGGAGTAIAGKSAGSGAGAAAGARPAAGASASASSSGKAASGPAVVVSDEKGTKTIDCRGRGVTVMGNGNTLTLRGTCGRVDVKGNENIIGVEAVHEIAMTGNNNRVTWTRAAEGDQPATNDLGNGNAIRRAAPLP